MSNIFKIIRISRPLHRVLTALSVLIVLSAAVQQATPIMLKFIVDEIELQLRTETGNLQNLYLLISLTFAISLFSIILDSVNERIGDYIGGRLGKYLTEKFYKKILTLPQQYFDSEVSGKIVNQLTRGILSIQEFVNAATNFIVPAFLQSIFSIAVLAYFSIPIAFLALLIFPVYIAISHYSTQRWGQEEVKKNRLEDISRGRIQEVIANIKLVKSYNHQAQEWDFISQKLKSIVKIYDRQSTIYHLLNFARNFGLELVLIIVVFVVFHNTFTGAFTLGAMVLILQLLSQLRRPLFAMSFILERIQRAESGSREFFTVLELPSTEQIALSNPERVFTTPTLEFRNVSFQYQQSGSVLRDVSFLLDRKETVALVGHSGAGKTTIVNLILKFYEPTAGEILLSGKSYNELEHQSVRANIALVFQESELFSSTVRENVAYGITNSSEAALIAALKKAHAYDFVRDLPEGLDAEIGERGVKLSGGQKQRIQIARAILRNAPILILDEATSSLDAKSEKLVQDALENLMQDKLVIVIAHRFSTLQNADRVLVLDKGKIVDSGNPQELARRTGIYSELLRYQIEGNKKLLEQYELY